MLKFLRIFHYRGKSAGKRKKQAKVLDQPCFDSYANVHVILKSLQRSSLIVPEFTLKSILTRSNNSHKAPIMFQNLWSAMLCPSRPRLMKYKSFS